MTTYFKILIVRLYVFKVLNTYVKFFSNQILSTIQSTNFFMHNVDLHKIKI